MITANEALTESNKIRSELADAFAEQHKDVLDRIEAEINANPANVELYYDNMGPLQVDPFPLGLALMKLGYGVKLANPASKTSGLYIRWARDCWTVDNRDFTWMH